MHIAMSLYHPCECSQLTLFLHAYRSGQISQPIWHRLMSCSSSDTCINDCQTCPTIKSTLCNHYEDVTISCSECWMTTPIVLRTYHLCRYVIFSASGVPKSLAEVSVCRFSGPYTCKFEYNIVYVQIFKEHNFCGLLFQTFRNKCSRIKKSS